MGSPLETSGRALAAGVGLTLLVMLVWVAAVGVDRLGFTSFLLRWLHTFGGMVWVGMIWFVNFVQLAAVQQADDAGRAVLARSIVPKVATLFRHASHLTLVTGVLLLVTSGYLLDRMIFTAEVYIPPLRNLLLWGGTLGGLAMWGLVHLAIWPNLRIVLGERPGDAAAKAKAAKTVRACARLNLVLAVPVTFVMVAAAHLY